MFGARPLHLLWLAAITAAGVIAAIVGLAVADRDDTASVTLLTLALVSAFIASSAIVRVADRRKRFVVQLNRRADSHRRFKDFVWRRYLWQFGEGIGREEGMAREAPAVQAAHSLEARRRWEALRRDVRQLTDLGAYEEAAELDEISDDLRAFITWADERL